MVILSYFLFGRDFAQAVFLGGFLVVGNFLYIDWALQKKLKDKDGKYKKEFKLTPMFFVEGAIKTIIMLGLIVFLLVFLEINKVGFSVGMIVMFVPMSFGYLMR